MSNIILSGKAQITSVETRHGKISNLCLSFEGDATCNVGALFDLLRDQAVMSGRAVDVAIDGIESSVIITTKQ